MSKPASDFGLNFNNVQILQCFNIKWFMFLLLVRFTFTVFHTPKYTGSLLETT